jgi:hypothetical protein
VHFQWHSGTIDYMPVFGPSGVNLWSDSPFGVLQVSEIIALVFLLRLFPKPGADDSNPISRLEGFYPDFSLSVTGKRAKFLSLLREVVPIETLSQLNGRV